MPNHSETPPDSLRQTINTYNQIAEDYVARSQRNGRWKTVFPELQQFIEQVPSGGRVLDLGCGPGHHTELMNGHGLRAIGADLSWGMLTQARELVTGEFLQADMRYIPLATGQFDAVWMCASMLHLPRQEAPRALGEVSRVLRPDGVLNVIVKMGQGEALRTNLGERYFTFYSLDEILGLVDDAGFAIRWHDVKEDEGFDPWINLMAAKR